MSWNDPCDGCENPRYGCTCPPIIREPKAPKEYDLNGLFQVRCSVFFGGKTIMARDLTYEDAIGKLGGGDVYTDYYIVTNDCPDSCDYDYEYRVPEDLLKIVDEK